MPYYRCVFLKENGDLGRKVLAGTDKQSVRDSVDQTQHRLIRIRRAWLSGLSIRDFSFGGVKYREFLVFNQKLIILLKAGVPVPQALRSITENHRRGVLRDILVRAERNINNGMPISEAFDNSQIPFHRIYTATLLAGEQSGQLNTLLQKYNKYLEQVTTFRRKLVKALTYPTVLLVFMLVIVNVVLTFAIPRFVDFYQGMNAQLPAVTRRLISVSRFVSAHLLLFITVPVGGYILIKLVERLRQDVVILDAVKVRLPVAGRLILDNGIAVFSRTMAILLTGGMTVPAALRIALGTFRNRYHAKKLRDIPARVEEGRLLSECLREVKFLPSILVEIVRVGEESGNLQGVLEKNADYFETSIDTRTTTMISLVEPVLIVFFGLLVAYMLMSIFLPIFSSVQMTI